MCNLLHVSMTMNGHVIMTFMEVGQLQSIDCSICSVVFIGLCQEWFKTTKGRHSCLSAVYTSTVKAEQVWRWGFCSVSQGGWLLVCVIFECYQEWQVIFLGAKVEYSR